MERRLLDALVFDSLKFSQNFTYSKTKQRKCPTYVYILFICLFRKANKVVLYIFSAWGFSVVRSE